MSAGLAARARLAALHHAPALVVTVAFVVSRLVYRGVLGVRFDTAPFGYFIQYVKPWFLEHDFARSMLHLHQQAPLQNLVVGGAWKLLGPSIAFRLFDVALLTIGFAFGHALLALLRRLGVGTILATVTTTAFITSPFFVLHEAWLFYPLPVAFLLVLAALALLRFYEEGTLRAALGFFAVVALTALIRNIYGLVWLAAVVAVMLLRPPVVRPPGQVRRTILKAVAGPALVMWLAGAMPSFTVGPAASSSAAVWANIGYRVYHGLPPAERQRLHDEGVISKALELEPFSPVPQLSEVRVQHPPTGVPLLDMTTTPDGKPNHFTLEYLLIAEKHLKPEGKLLVSRYPRVYVDAVIDGLIDWYPSPPTRDLVMHRTANRRRVQVVERVLGRLAGENQRGRWTALAIGLPVVFLFGVWTVVRPRSILPAERATVALVAVMLLTIAYVTLGTTMISYGDYSRYRFDVDAYYTVLGALLLARLGAAGRAALARRSS